MINLIKDTIDKNDIDRLIEWLQTYPRLTKDKWTVEFEEQWCRYLGCKYSVFVNSGSSANLAMLYVTRLLYEETQKSWNKRIIIPAISWATDLAPAIQLGFEPYLCEASKDNLGVDLNHFEDLCKNSFCRTAIVVHVLGIPAQMNEIKKICEKYDVVLLEDSCESVGSTCNGVKTGRFGLMSSFSGYYGHHFSCIEAGLVCTDDKKIYDLLKMVRSHGWDRDLDSETQHALRTSNNIKEFDAKFAFYVPGFNIRSTDLQAYIGIKQLSKLYENNEKRHQNYLKYQNLIKNEYWKLPYSYDFISNFAYPVIHPNRDKIARLLTDNDIECRPLISGSLSEHPVYKNHVKLQAYQFQMIDEQLQFAKTVHRYGMYIPNHPYLTSDEIELISALVNQGINE